MENAVDSDSTGSSRSLPPPQARLPLSSSVSSSSQTRASSAAEPALKVSVPNSVLRAPVVPTVTMNKDGCFTYVHMHKSQHADVFEDFCKDKLPASEVYVPPDLQPVNPEEEDDVVPDQHAAYGVQKATQKAREPAWQDLGLVELMARGPAPGAAGRGRGGLRRRGGHPAPYRGLLR